jgi:hypothetical protein
MILDPAWGERMRRQPDPGQEVRGKLPLERDIVDGEDGRGPRAGKKQQRRRQSRMPIVSVDDIRHETRDQPLTQSKRGVREGGETQAVVRPVETIRPAIGIARPVIKMRSIEHEQFETCRRAGNESRAAAE